MYHNAPLTILRAHHAGMQLKTLSGRLPLAPPGAVPGCAPPPSSFCMDSLLHSGAAAGAGDRSPSSSGRSSGSPSPADSDERRSPPLSPGSSEGWYAPVAAAPCSPRTHRDGLCACYKRTPPPMAPQPPPVLKTESEPPKQPALKFSVSAILGSELAAKPLQSPGKTADTVFF